MVICFVCPANEVVYIQKRLVVHDCSLTFESDGAYKPGDNVAVFGYTDRRMNFFFQIVPEFCFVYFQVASDKYNDVFVAIVNLIYDRFAHFSLFDAEFTRKPFYRLYVWSIYLFQSFEFAVDIMRNTLRDFYVCLVIATFVRTNRKRIFAYIRQEHKFVRNVSAHHTAVAFNRDKIFRAATAEYPIIRL